jgi:hypothetical protein
MALCGSGFCSDGASAFSTYLSYLSIRTWSTIRLIESDRQAHSQAPAVSLLL